MRVADVMTRRVFRIRPDMKVAHVAEVLAKRQISALPVVDEDDRLVGIVTEGDLPEARAKTCPAEARRVSKAWLRLLIPHVAPKYEMTEEKANRLFEQRERERNRNAEVPYVR